MHEKCYLTVTTSAYAVGFRSQFRKHAAGNITQLQDFSTCSLSSIKFKSFLIIAKKHEWNWNTDETHNFVNELKWMTDIKSQLNLVQILVLVFIQWYNQFPWQSDAVMPRVSLELLGLVPHAGVSWLITSKDLDCN